MPIGRSAKKSLRKSLKLKQSNVSFKNKLKDEIKKYLAKPTEKGFVEVQSILDKAKKKNVWHINKIARIKSRLSKMIGQAGVVATKKKATVKKKPVAKKIVKKTSKKMS